MLQKFGVSPRTGATYRDQGIYEYILWMERSIIQIANCTIRPCPGKYQVRIALGMLKDNPSSLLFHYGPTGFGA